MATISPSNCSVETETTIAAQHEQQQKLNVYENTKDAINECIKQLNEFTSALNEVCNRANSVALAIQSLECFVTPEVIGSSLHFKEPKKIFDSTGHLCEVSHTLCEIMMAYTTKLKNETVDELSNFVMQVVCPNLDELKGVHDRNKKIINEFREGYFGIMNHFFVVAAELMEKFLICGNCDAPIGFPHAIICTHHPEYPSYCNELNFTWKKSQGDDKFITYGMQFNFNELVLPPSERKDIQAMINRACERQQNNNINRIERFLSTSSMSMLSKSWPLKWMRNGNDKNKNKIRSNLHQQQQINRNKFTYPVHIAHPPLFNPSIWSPSSKDAQSTQSYEVVSFSYQQQQQKETNFE